jgi:NitT/TauT family transport system substrate-binding protein
MLVIDDSTGGDALMVKPGLDEVTAIAHLKGRRVGVEIRSAGHYLLARALADAGLTLDDVEVVPINLPESESAFVDFQVDAVATAEPWLTKLLARGARVLYDSNQTPGEFQRVLAVREEAASQTPQALRKMIDAHFDLVERDWQTWPPPILEGICRREGLSKADLIRAMSRVQLHSRAAQARLLDGDRPELSPTFGKVAEALLAAGMMEGSMPPTVPVDGRLTQP